MRVLFTVLVLGCGGGSGRGGSRDGAATGGDVPVLDRSPASAVAACGSGSVWSDIPGVVWVANGDRDDCKGPPPELFTPAEYLVDLPEWAQITCWADRCMERTCFKPAEGVIDMMGAACTVDADCPGVPIFGGGGAETHPYRCLDYCDGNGNKPGVCAYGLTCGTFEVCPGR